MVKTNTVAGPVTNWFRTEELLDPKEPVTPLYSAVMGCEPPAKALVLQVATPLDTVMVSSVVEPSLNTTVPPAPVAVAPPACTVAVKVTLPPTNEGLPEDTSISDVDTSVVTSSTLKLSR